MFYLCREKNKTLFWANKALFYRLRKRNANRNIQKTASNHNFWICREYAFCLRIWSRLCMRMRRPVQDGLYCESLWNPAKLYQSILSVYTCYCVNIFVYVIIDIEDTSIHVTSRNYREASQLRDLIMLGSRPRTPKGLKTPHFRVGEILVFVCVFPVFACQNPNAGENPIFAGEIPMCQFECLNYPLVN